MTVLLLGGNSCHKNKVTVTRKEFLSQKDQNSRKSALAIGRKLQKQEQSETERIRRIKSIKRIVSPRDTAQHLFVESLLEVKILNLQST